MRGIVMHNKSLFRLWKSCGACVPSSSLTETTARAHSFTATHSVTLRQRIVQNGLMNQILGLGLELCFGRGVRTDLPPKDHKKQCISTHILF